MRKILVVVGLVLFGAVGVASAHTISIGFVPAGPGSISFWYGSYHGYDGVTELTEGSLTLVGINGNPFPSTTVPFALHTGTKPTGLDDGTTNFYATNAGPLAATDVDGLGPVTSWQGVTFTGLQAGDYQFTYVPIASPSAHWDPWNAGILSNTVTISGALLGGATSIPTLSPTALILLIIAVALIGIGLSRRRASI
ncbi:MAG: IPTL-CTERM sorting domain-containing protein [Porticoccaceae bacterium]